MNPIISYCKLSFNELLMWLKIPSRLGFQSSKSRLGLIIINTMLCQLCLIYMFSGATAISSVTVTVTVTCQLQ
jgi:hypothetical protein